MRPRASRVLALAALGSLAACQQLLELDVATVSVSAVSRICECTGLRQQGPEFAGSEIAACEEALEAPSDDLLLALAASECTDCANVIPCYAQLTEAGNVGDACSASAACESWACCQGVFSVVVVLDGDGFEPELISTPPAASCCASCQPCGDALAAINSETEVVACAEARDPLLELLLCLAENTDACPCPPPGEVTSQCITCLANQPDAAERCAAQFSACFNDLARPVPVDP